ncbi:TetR/AcrR family transcriptional regulator [Nocardia sp. CDC159]|uniref:TetR/AcrR family transcriptional regulator n=1 Tax=Nocardia pulmonis TaxID=2951408 RepID=A0A9X2E660_9NOCA|nr:MULTISPECIES: TetR/AcrR family transcriptional regulator [Nocardia]MCM6772321.1 TetR/AcrR family transcriptional regulator [Nocardia pulmonis]MCM6785021.1 TetR/AcrR family transcriptional regulator [Nocardia sp. CDC159]
MGNREDLLTGARKAILERGLAKVTARDIAAAAGVSLAAIGYHFGSKDRLVVEAVTEAVGTEIGDGMYAAIRDATGEGSALWESLAGTWNGMLDVVRDHREQLQLSFENASNVMRSEELRAYMAEACETAYEELAQLLRELHPELSAEAARAVGKVYFVLFQGWALMGMMAPAADPLTGEDVALAVKTLRGK